MRLARITLASLVVWCALTVAAHAEDKEVTLKGKIMCAKCALKEGTKCQTAIKVKEGGKDVIYYFLDKGVAEAHHEAVCGGGQKDGTVTGPVSEKDGKKWITPKKVEYASGAKGALEGPRWFTDYGMAHEHGQKEKKPLAVFLASGDSGWEKLASDGKPGEEIHQVLGDQYVCVYLDTGTKEGKHLASVLEIPSGLGLVISDRTGKMQAFWHEGALTRRDLGRYLQTYSDPGRTVRGTDTNPAQHEGHHHAAPTGKVPPPTGLIPGLAPTSGRCPHCGSR